jgi:hypothetical protein
MYSTTVIDEERRMKSEVNKSLQSDKTFQSIFSNECLGREKEVRVAYDQSFNENFTTFDSSFKFIAENFLFLLRQFSDLQAPSNVHLAELIFNLEVCHFAFIILV